MQVNFDTNKPYNPNFGSVRVTNKALSHLKTRFMTDSDIKRFETVMDRFKAKGDFIEGTLDEVNGDLAASIFSMGRYSDTKYEGFFSRIFRSPIHFIEKWANRADKVEERLLNDIRLEELVKAENA